MSLDMRMKEGEEVHLTSRYTIMGIGREWLLMSILASTRMWMRIWESTSALFSSALFFFRSRYKNESLDEGPPAALDKKLVDQPPGLLVRKMAVTAEEVR